MTLAVQVRMRFRKSPLPAVALCALIASLLSCSDDVASGESRSPSAHGDTVPTTPPGSNPSDASTAATDSSGTPSDGSTPVAAAAPAPIVAWRLELPCTNPVSDAPHVCNGNNSVKVTKDFGGDPTKIYDAVIRVRGIVESHIYLEGNGEVITKVTPAPYAATDVNPKVPTALLPPGASENDIVAVFALDVPEPKSMLYLNVFDRIGWTYKIDYTAQIKIRGGATLTLSYSDGNNLFYRNRENVPVPGVAPYPQPFDGEIVQIDTVSIAEAH